MKMTVKQAFINDFDHVLFYLINVAEDVPSKLVGAVVAFFSLQVTGFYGDEYLLILLARLMVVDLIFGVIDAIISKTWNWGTFLSRGVCKFPVYAMYVFFVACADYAVEHTVQMQVYFVECFVAYLIASEIYSILRHLKYIGVPVPAPLLYFAFGMREKLTDMFTRVSVPAKEEKKEKEND